MSAIFSIAPSRVGPSSQCRQWRYFQTPSLRDGALLHPDLHDADAEVRAADVGGEDRVVTFEDPARREVEAADESRLVGIDA